MTNSDYINGWDAGVLQKAVDNCHCNPYGDVSFNQCFFVFSLYQNIWFLGLINSLHAASIRIFSAWTRVNNVTSRSLSMNKVKSFFSQIYISYRHSYLSYWYSPPTPWWQPSSSRRQNRNRLHWQQSPTVYLTGVCLYWSLTYRHGSDRHWGKQHCCCGICCTYAF